GVHRRTLRLSPDDAIVESRQSAAPNYPLHDRDDAMDALYWALMGMPDVLVMKDPGEGLPGTTWKKKKTANPFLAFGGR
ncbi:MAG: hypothetical protein ACWGQW_04925, partial [bacterium]